MSACRRVNPALARASLHAALWLALPLVVAAQQVPAASGSSPSGGVDMRSMRMDPMPGMDTPAPAASTPTPAKAATSVLPPTGVKGSRKTGKRSAMPGMATQAMPPQGDQEAQPETEGMQAMDHGSMQAMDHSTQGTDHGSMQGMQHGAMEHMSSGRSMQMGPMQGGSPPPTARSPDYSDGIGYAPTHGLDMAMDDNGRIGMLSLDKIEAFHSKDGNGQAWEAQAWYGNTSDKLWMRTEGQRSQGKFDEGDLEAFWNHTISAFWSTQLGARHDLGGPSRDWAAFGFQGLAPYWFEIEATGYVGRSGRTAARLRVDYELRFTQRLILQPEIEANFYGKGDPDRDIGSGLSDASFGLRLRYEIRRPFAPYVGMVWTRRFGGTADFARESREGIFERRWVAGVRIWF